VHTPGKLKSPILGNLDAHWVLIFFACKTDKDQLVRADTVHTTSRNTAQVFCICSLFINGEIFLQRKASPLSSGRKFILSMGDDLRQER
jgi:hypothetical protein